MFFAISPKSAEISDASSALIGTYKAVKRDVEKVLRFLEPLQLSRSEFERVKRSRLSAPSSKAGAFIYLNKACWNGLYRVNSKGQFNVPYGWPKSGFIVDSSQLRECAELLRRRNVSIKCQDFSAISPRVKAGDFVFFDPPYVTSHNMNGFVDWNEKLFCWDDQLRLSVLARKLVDKGANVLITNADHRSVRDLYVGFGTSTISRHSTLASDISKRKNVSEAVFFAGPNYNRRTADHFHDNLPFDFQVRGS